MTQPQDEWPELSSASNAAWDAQADIWDTRMSSDGNDFHLQLIRPATERLLELQPGERVLDVGCGNGIFSRRMARIGAIVTAVDVSEPLLERARNRTTDADAQVTYKRLDATSEEQLSTLDTYDFDAVVCNMTLMDISTVRPLANALPRILKQSGRFIFSVMHPCFNNSVGTSRLVEEIQDEHGIKRIYSIKVSSYITPASGKSRGICGRNVQFYFHRPLSTLLNTFFESGLMLDRVEEPVFPRQERERELGQAQFSEIPWAFIGRMRVKMSV